MKFTTQEKQIGCVLAALASHDMHLSDAAVCIQHEIDSLRQEIRNASIKACAKIAFNNYAQTTHREILALLDK